MSLKSDSLDNVSSVSIEAQVEEGKKFIEEAKEIVEHTPKRRVKVEKKTNNEPVKKYTQLPGEPLIEVKPSTYKPVDIEESIDLTKNKIVQEKRAIAHMVEDRDWKTEWLDKYGITFLTYEEATTTPYSYSPFFTSKWGGFHFPLGKYEPDKYYGQFYNWYPDKKCRAKDLERIKNVDKKLELSKYISACPNDNSLLLLDPKKYLDPNTKEEIIAVTEDLQGVYQMTERTGKRFIANAYGCHGILKGEIEDIQKGKEIITNLAKLFNSDGGVFIFDNDIFSNFAVFHAAIRVLLYGNCLIKVLSKDTIVKMGLDEFARSNKTIKDYKSIPEYSFTDFLESNQFNFKKNLYSPRNLFREVKGSRNGGEKLQLIQRIYYGELSEKPTLTYVNNQNPNDIVREIEDLLANIESTRTIYRQGDIHHKLVTVVKNEANLYICELNEQSLRAQLDDLIEFNYTDEDGKKRKNCSKDIANRMFNLITNTRLKELNKISTIPVLRKNGSIICRSGYHEDIKTIVDLDETKYIFNKKISKKQAKESLKFLKHILREFIFKTENDMSAAISMLLTGVSRNLYDLAPMFVMGAHIPGTGKSALVDILSYMLTRKQALHTGYNEEEEMNKRLVPLLERGSPFISIDNARGSIANMAIESALTLGYFSGRTLGRSEMKNIDAKIVWLLNGNNLQFNPDLQRRIIAIGLDKRCEGSREYEVKDFKGYIKDSSGEIVVAAIEIIRAFLQRDTTYDPEWPTPIASFEDWDNVVRRSLLWLDEPDPWVATTNLVDADDDRSEFGELLEILHNIFGSDEFTISAICTTCFPGHNSNVAGIPAKYIPFFEWVKDAGMFSFTDQRFNNKKIGSYLSMRDGNMASGFRLDKTRNKAQNKVHYQITKLTN